MTSGRHLKLPTQVPLLSLAVIVVFLLCGCGGGGGSATPTSNNTQGSSSNSDSGCSGSTTEQLCTNTLSFTSSNFFLSPNIIAIDGSNKVWVGSQTYGMVTMIDPTNAASDCSTGCIDSFKSTGTEKLRDIAIDEQDNVWLALNVFGGTTPSSARNDRAVSVINPNSPTIVTAVYPNSNQILSGNAVTFYGQAAAYSLAIDNTGNIIVGGTTIIRTNNVADNTLEMIVIDNSGNIVTTLTPPDPALSLVYGPGGIAIDSAGNIWAVFTDGTSTALAMYPVNAQAAVVYSGGGLNPTRIAVDNAANLWVVNAPSVSASFGSVTKIAAGASADCSTGCSNYISAKFLNIPVSLAVDGANNVWVATKVSLPDLGSSFSDTVGAVKIEQGAATDCSSGCTAYTSFDFTSANSSPGDIAVDGGGNVWIEDNGGSKVVQFPQVAASTTTPIVRQTR